MASAKILLQAKAKRLGIEGYRSLSESELQDVIARAEKGTTAPAKGSTAKAAKGSTNGKPVKGSTAKGSTAKGSASKAVKGSAGTSAPAKSKSQKSATKAAAKGTAKRLTATAGKGKRTAAAKGSTSKVASKRKSTTAKRPPKGEQGTRNTIDLKSIDWNAETNVGRLPGKRQDVLKALKRFKNYDKVFAHLQPNAKSYYKGKSKVDAEKLLRWLIARVAYDFAYKSGQHEMGTRAANGDGIRNSTAGKAPAAKKKTAAAPARKPARKASAARTARPAAKRTGTTRGKTKTAAAKRAPARRGLAKKGS